MRTLYLQISLSVHTVRSESYTVRYYVHFGLIYLSAKCKFLLSDCAVAQANRALTGPNTSNGPFSRNVSHIDERSQERSKLSGMGGISEAHVVSGIVSFEFRADSFS